MKYHVGRGALQLGTFTKEQILENLATGTFQGTDLGWTEGMGDWTPLATLFPSFATAPALVPATTGGPPPLTQQPQPPPIRPVAPQVPAFPSASKTSGLAVSSVVMGFLSLLFWLLTAIPAVICGHLALGRIKRSNGTLGGHGLAVTGLVLGYMSICITPILLGLAIPAFNGVQEKARQMQAINNARQVMIALKAHAGDHHGQYPAALEELTKEGLLTDAKVFEYPQFRNWSPDKGYDYLGAGGADGDDPAKVILRSRSQGPHGKRIEARNDGSVSIVTHEPAP